MAERRGRRLSLSCRLFFFGEDDFEGEATVLDLSTNGCQATSLTQMQVGMVLRLSLFLHDQQWPLRIDEALVRWVKGANFGLEFTGIRLAQRERVRADHDEGQDLRNDRLDQFLPLQRSPLLSTA